MPKIQLWLGRERNISSGLQALGTHFLPLDHRKMRLGWIRKSDFQMFVCLFDLIFRLLTIQNATWFRSRNRCLKDLHCTCKLFSASGTAQNATRWIKKKDFSGVYRTLRTHFLPLGQPKCDYDEDEKAIIKVIEWHFEVIFCFLTNRKCDFSQVDKGTIHVVEWQLKVIFFLLTTPKFVFCEVQKTMYQVVARQWEHNFFLLTSPKCDLG